MTGRAAIEEQLASAVTAALLRLAAGGFQPSSSHYDDIKTAINDDASSHEQWKEQLKRISNGSISFTNNDESDVDGKPHDVECRAALSLFHIVRNIMNKGTKQSNTDESGNKKPRKKKKKQTTSCNNTTIISDANGISFEVISDLGTRRQVSSPKSLADLLSLELEKELSSTYSSLEMHFFDIRSNDSGIICIVSEKRSNELHKAGKLPCGHCVRWFKGQKGLWWHHLQAHNITYASATESAADAVNSLAVVLFQEQQEHHLVEVPESGAVDGIAVLEPTLVESNEAEAESELDPFEMVKLGNFEEFTKIVESRSFSPSTEIDRNGATTLHWAAGAGNVSFVSYLVEKCQCDPNQKQRAKRAFRGRTPLHWAARNGHLEVVKYLVHKCENVNINATTQDGTTAFCWASWQGHLDVMRFLRDAGCDIHLENSFGCNAVLWTAQGDATIESLSWLLQAGMDFYTVNANGHTALHKAAQRGSMTACEWIVDTLMRDDPRGLVFIAPDAEGHCPSDLCSMDGHKELAEWLLSIECSFIGRYAAINKSLPAWLQDEMNTSKLASSGRSHCAVRRMVDSISNNESDNCKQKKARLGQEVAVNLYDID